MKVPAGFTTSQRESRYADIKDHRRSASIDLEADGFVRRLDVAITLQSSNDEHVLTHVIAQELSGEFGGRMMLGLKVDASYFPARHGRSASVIVWIMAGMNSHMIQFDTDDAFSTCDLLNLGNAFIESVYDTSAWRIA